MDRLLVMRTFAAVARAATFSGAAVDLGISPSMVSRHVADLESQLGVRLVNRTPRSVSLTAAGTKYAEFCERILLEIDETDAQMTDTQDSAEGHLSIISPKWIGLMDLGTAVGAFVEEHPAMRVRLELGGVSDRLYDFLDRGFDIAFHARDPRDSRVRVRRISDLPFVLAASAEYLSRHPAPRTLAELNEHRLLSHTSDQTWRLGEGTDIVHFKVQDPVVSTNAYLTLEQLIESGLGIGIIPRRSAHRALAAGSVVEVLPEFPVQSRSLYAVHGPGDRTPERVKIFLDFMRDWYRRTRLD